MTSDKKRYFRSIFYFSKIDDQICVFVIIKKLFFVKVKMALSYSKKRDQCYKTLFIVSDVKV